MTTLYPGIGVYGFPKSGNTWLEGIFAALGKSVLPSYTQSDIHINRANKSAFNPHPVICIADSPAIVFKSHEKFSDKVLNYPDATALGISHMEKVILVKRNPFDMLLSYLNYAIWLSRKSINSGGGGFKPILNTTLKMI